MNIPTESNKTKLMISLHITQDYYAEHNKHHMKMTCSYIVHFT